MLGKLVSQFASSLDVYHKVYVKERERDKEKV